MTELIDLTGKHVRRKVRELRKVKLALGYALMDAAPLIDASTTFAQRCDLLSVNAAS